MPTIPQRVASTFAVLCGQYGDVTKMAKGREQSRQSLYREAEQVADAVDGAAARARIDDLQRVPPRLLRKYPLRDFAFGIGHRGVRISLQLQLRL